MATRKICSVQGCRKGGKLRRGWCPTHYTKWWKYGDPLAGSTCGGEPMLFIQDVAMAHEGDECLLWPYTKANYGYGEVNVDGRKRLVHRVVCELVYGKPPDGKNDAAHSCGVRLCCNPRHLRWASRAENVADTLVHGTRAWGERTRNAKLTRKQVEQIRQLVKNGVRKKDIAERFNISSPTVCDIEERRTWKWLPEG